MVPTVLFILHLPPPVHGAAMVGQYIRDSKLINSTFDCHYINLTTAESLQDIGKVGLKKLWRFLMLLITVFRYVRQVKPRLVYITPNYAVVPSIRICVVVQMLKWMKVSSGGALSQ